MSDATRPRGLRLVPPAGWISTDDGGPRRASAPDGGVTLSWTALAPLPGRPSGWILDHLTADLPPGEYLDELTIDRTQVDQRWSIVLADAHVAGGHGFARRLGAFYAEGDRCAVAMAVGHDRAAWDREQARLRHALLTAAPER